MPGAETLKSPPSRPLRDLPIASFATFDDVRVIKSALRDLENGHFARAAQMVDAMGRDDRIEGVLTSRLDALLGRPLEFKEGSGERSTEAAAAFASIADEAFPHELLEQLLTWGLMLNAGVGELVWDRQADRWTPRLVKVWHPQYLRWDWQAREYRILTQDGEVPVVPGDLRWVVYMPHGLHRGWMRSLVRPLAVPWIVRQWGSRDWARYSEVHGMPARVGIVPAGASPDDKKDFLQSLANLGNEPVIEVSQDENGKGFDFKFAEAAALGWQGFQNLINKAEENIAIVILGQNLTTTVKSGGSYAAAEVHERVAIGRTRFDDKTLSGALLRQVIRPWAGLNYGSPEAAPVPHWVTEDSAADAAVDPTTALNGAQVASLVDVVTRVATNQIPRETGVAIIEASFPLTLEQAEQIMGDVGRGFVPAPTGTQAPASPAPPPTTT